jgi:hypothetical protein
VDPRLRRDAYGARVVVHAGDNRLLRVVQPAFSYLSSSDPRAHFGIPAGAPVDRVEVEWPDGLRERFAVAGVDRSIEVRRGEGEALP